MKRQTKYQIVKKSWMAFLACIAIAVIVPIFMCMPFIRPESEPFPEWGARSGSITVIFALLAEIYAARIMQVFQNSEGMDQEIIELPKYLKVPEKFYTATVFVVAVVGTIIWGYGDFLLKSP